MNSTPLHHSHVWITVNCLFSSKSYCRNYFCVNQIWFHLKWRKRKTTVLFTVTLTLDLFNSFIGDLTWTHSRTSLKYYMSCNCYVFHIDGPHTQWVHHLHSFHVQQFLLELLYVNSSRNTYTTQQWTLV